MQNHDRQGLHPVTIGIILGITIGFCDLLIFIDQVGKQVSIPNLIIPITLTSVVLFIAYLAAQYVVEKLLGSFFKLRLESIAILLAFLIGSTALLISVRLSLPEFTELTVLQRIVPALLIFIASIAVYFSSEYFLLSTHRLHFTALAIALPFLGAEAAVARTFVGGRILVAVAFPLFALTLWAFYKLRNSSIPRRLLYLFAIVLFVGAFFRMTQSRSVETLDVSRKDKQLQNVILITIDTLRSDSISSYNSKARKTANIDLLAQDGILFQNAFSEAPWTLPAVISIMTGVSPMIHGATGPHSQIPNGLPTLAEYMQKAGFQTAAIGQNVQLVEKISRGFQSYDFFPKMRIIGLGGFLVYRFLSELGKTDVSTSDLTTKAQKWLVDNKENSFFLWLHYYDPHIPYAPPSRFSSEKRATRIGRKCPTSLVRRVRSGFFVPTEDEKKWIKALYLSEVSYVDSEIGKLINVLKRESLYDSSLIILTSDHGEEFWEHGGFEHGHTVYDEVLRVPLIVKLPKSSAGAKLDVPVPVSSVVPTILDLCGIHTASGSFSSPSLTQLWNSNSSLAKEESIVSSGLLYYEERVSLHFNDIKYIHNQVTNREELFNLKQDRAEQKSIADQEPEKLSEARKILDEKKKQAQQLKSKYHILEVRKELAPEELEETLRSIGYVQ